jgi:hypothetical protein
LIAAPRQKLTLEEKAIIRDGGTPEGWSRAKRAQKDRDACWTLKRGRSKLKPEGAQRQTIQIAVPVFSYKSQIGIDRRHGLIRRWTVTDAAQHDSRSFPTLLDPGNTALVAVSPYQGLYLLGGAPQARNRTARKQVLRGRRSLRIRQSPVDPLENTVGRG